MHGGTIYLSEEPREEVEGKKIRPPNPRARVQADYQKQRLGVDTEQEKC